MKHINHTDEHGQKTSISGAILFSLYEAWYVETAADLCDVLRYRPGLGPDAPVMVSRLEELGLIEINNAVADGPYSFTEKGLRILGIPTGTAPAEGIIQ